MDPIDDQGSARKKIKIEQVSTKNFDEGAPLQNGPLMASSNNNEFNQFTKEAECGITEFVSPELTGFTGILKKRYTDFLVNEILPSGEVLHLNNAKETLNEKPDAGILSSEAGSFGSLGDIPKESLDSAEPQVTSQPNENRSDAQVSDALLSTETIDLDKTAIQANHGGMPQNQPPSTDRFKETVKLYRKGDTLEVINSQKATEERVSIPGNQPPPDRDYASKTLPSTAQSAEGDLGHVSELPESSVLQKLGEESLNFSPNDWQNYARPSEGFQLSSEDSHFLLSYLSYDFVKGCVALYNRILNSPHRKVKDYGTCISSSISSRQARTEIHMAIRRIFGGRLESMTDIECIVVTAASAKPNSSARTPKRSKEQGKPSQSRGKLSWQKYGGEYLHFTLYKENKDTMEVITYLARTLMIKPKDFQFAGTKDRRGITVQRISVYRVLAERMMDAGRSLRNAKIGNFEYQPQGLQLGDLGGNEFIITLRDCYAQEKPQTQAKVNSISEVIGNAVKNLRSRGFINYYGLQRFGTFSTRTDTIGMKMLQGNFQSAVEAILYYSPMSLAAAQNSDPSLDKISSDDKARAIALDLYKTGGKPFQALDKLPRRFSAEASIIKYLGSPRRKGDYFGALQTIPRNLRLMYVHAYQSLIWNIAASERWKRFGDRVLEGDLVLVNEHPEKTGNAVEPNNVDVDGEIIVYPADEDRAANVEDMFTRARALTKDEADSGSYSIFDIVLPTPGFDILYPANEMADVYRSIMASDRGGGLDPLDMRRKWKDISLSGSYRKLLARPGSDIIYEIRTYTTENEQFVQTDVDRLRETKQEQAQTNFPPNVNDRNERSLEAANDHNSPSIGEIDGIKVKIAMILTMQLGSGQYATMALRELMKAGGLQTYKPDFGGGR